MPASSEIAPPRASIHDDGTVEGYASLFGAIDQANDMVMPGAFAATLRQRDVRRIPMLFQHDPAEPIGVWLSLEEDWLGLRVRGKLIPEVVRARELLGLLRAGASDGLSIGFRTVRGRIDPKTRVRRLHQVDLWEISLVTLPLLAGARVRAVKDVRLPSRPKASFARTRAEGEWRTIAAAGCIADALRRVPNARCLRPSPKFKGCSPWRHLPRLISYACNGCSPRPTSSASSGGSCVRPRPTSIPTSRAYRQAIPTADNGRAMEGAGHRLIEVLDRIRTLALRAEAEPETGP